MRVLVLAAILTLFVAPAVLAGGPSMDMPQQQMAPEPKIIVVPPSKDEDSGWAVPVAVAAVGALGLVGAAYVSRKK